MENVEINEIVPTGSFTNDAEFHLYIQADKVNNLTDQTSHCLSRAASFLASTIIKIGILALSILFFPVEGIVRAAAAILTLPFVLVPNGAQVPVYFMFTAIINIMFTTHLFSDVDGRTVRFF